MPDIYMLDADRRPVPLKRVYCEDESAELQGLLASNLDLLPGDQIDPDDPCRWLLIRREVPVADPGTGSDRWSIDLLLADHNAKPTFVECKRFLDTRSRREVVGQMLEYAANGHYYWDAERLRELADKDAAGNSLDERLAALLPGDDIAASDFFQHIEDNLREGQVRLVCAGEAMRVGRTGVSSPDISARRFVVTCSRDGPQLPGPMTVTSSDSATK